MNYNFTVISLTYNKKVKGNLRITAKWVPEGKLNSIFIIINKFIFPLERPEGYVTEDSEMIR